MKNTKIICANSLLKSFYGVLDEVKPFLNDYTTDNLVVVPDKFSMNAEKMLFEYFGIDSLFNVHVVTLTRLVNKVLSGVLSREQILSKDSVQLLITKILLDNDDKFVALKNNASPQICEQFYNTIMQLKSSGISPEELFSKKENLNLSLKLEDIKLVYSEYQNLTQGKMFDSADLLDVFVKEFAKNKYYTSCRIFVGMFDSFSFKQLSSIVSIAKNARDFIIGLSANTKQNNKHIYLNETLADITQSFRTNKIEYEIKNIYSSLNGDFETLSQNLFGLSVKPKATDRNVLLVEAENIKDEVDFVARQIKREMYFSENFSQINVACSNLGKYTPCIEEIFSSYALPYYIDYSKTLSEHFFAKFLMNIFNIIASGYSRDYVLEFLKSDFAQMDKQDFFSFEDYITKFGLDYSALKNGFYDSNVEKIRMVGLSKLFSIENQILKCSTIENYVDLTKSIIDQFDCKNILEKIAGSDVLSVDIKNATSQVLDKIVSILDLIDGTLGNETCSFDYFKKLLENILSTTKINTVPQGVNKIFVGDAVSSSFYPSEVLYILGACDGSLPNYKNDCGMITDKEITMLGSKNLLNPTIGFVNKKAKYSLFELCLLPTKKLVISYPALSNGEASSPSEVFSAISSCLSVDGKKMPLYLVSSELDYIRAKKFGFDVDKFSYEYVFGGKTNAMNLATKNNTNSLCVSLKNNLIKKAEIKRNGTFDADSLFFAKGTFSVSQIEKYFACPYAHFVAYGLRLSEREKFGLENVDIGNFLHLVAEKFVGYLMQNNYEISQAQKEQIISNVLSTELMQTEGKLEQVRIHSLKNEANRLCDNILKQIGISKFKPTFVEKTFVSNATYEGLKLRGKIDRIDQANDFFVVFDYKTGKSEFSFRDVYFGNKIQILAYQSVLESLTGLIPVGAYYIPIKNKFLQEDDTSKFSGVCLANDDIIKMLDQTLEQNSKSEIFKIKYNLDGTLDSHSQAYALSPEEYVDLKNYVLSVMTNALKEIKSGYITPKPTQDACKYCKYSLLCKWNSEVNGYREQKTKIEKDFFAKKGK